MTILFNQQWNQQPTSPWYYQSIPLPPPRVIINPLTSVINNQTTSDGLTISDMSYQPISKIVSQPISETTNQPTCDVISWPTITSQWTNPRHHYSVNQWDYLSIRPWRDITNQMVSDITNQSIIDNNNQQNDFITIPTMSGIKNKIFTSNTNEWCRLKRGTVTAFR